MRAIKIDVVQRKVYEVELDPKRSLQSIYQHLEINCICQVGTRMPNGDCLVVDDNGLIRKDPIGGFIIGQYPQPLSGHGLIFGTNGGGETVDAKSDLLKIQTMVDFIDASELPMLY